MSRIACSVRKMREEVRKGPRRAKIRLPQPQVVRIMTRHVRGETNRKIAIAESVDRKTVARIVRAPEVQDYVRKLRERFNGLGDAALDAVQHALQELKDARIGYQLLMDIGVIQSAEERNWAANQPQSISDEAREKLVASLSPQDRILFGLLKMMQARAEGHGLPPESIAPPWN